MVKQCTKPIKASKDPPPISKQNPSIHATYSSNTHVPLIILKSVNDQLETSKLDTNRLTEYMQKQHTQKKEHWPQETLQNPHTQTTEIKNIPLYKRHKDRRPFFSK